MSDRGGTSLPSTTLVSTHSETEPLLQSRSHFIKKQAIGRLEDVEDVNTRILADDMSNSRRRLGLPSAIFLIFNRVIGAGIFTISSVVLGSTGSVGMALLTWILGSLVAAAGTAVYVEFGTGLPRSGGERIYMEYVFQRPAFMITCLCAAYGVLLSFISASSVAFGEYVLNALAYKRTLAGVRTVACICATFCLVVHGVFPNFGLRLQNALATFKLLILVLIAASGFLCLIGVPGFTVREEYDQPDNYTRQTFWAGSDLRANAFVNGMYAVIWAHTGYSNANYALSEVRDPVKTIKLAAPLAMCFVAFAYLSVNIAYFAVVSKADMLNGGAIPAALFFRNLYGPATERVLSLVISLSILGTILSILFTQGRVVQELGREGVLPYSSFFASNKPFGTPLPGLLTQYLVSILLLTSAPQGDAFLFIVNCISYPTALFNFIISGGLLLLYTDSFKSYNWEPPFRAYKSIIVFFFLSNVFLLAVPLIPPPAGHELYEYLPYYSHVVVALSIGALGVVYWFIGFQWMPARNGYKLERVTITRDDGMVGNVFRRIPMAMEHH